MHEGTTMTDRLDFHVPDDRDKTPLPAAEMTSSVGLFYAAILFILLLAAAIVDLDGLVEAMSVLPLGDPAMMANFTA